VNVGFLGAGHIAQALAEGWRRPSVTGAPQLAFFDVDEERRREAAAAWGGDDVLVLAVRPDQVGGALAGIAPLLGERALVSVAAGVELAELVAAVPAGSRVGRVMPNVAAALGLGVFLFVPGTLGPLAAPVASLFGLAGRVVTLPEDEFDTATAVAGCMPGLLGAIVQAFVRAGAAEGLSPATARQLAVTGVHGAAAIIARDGDPEGVMARAATPGGMTAAGIDALRAQGIEAAVHAAVAAAAARARMLT
jgi:pyrroline-5-carboxylate reductase